MLDPDTGAKKLKHLMRRIVSRQKAKESGDMISNVEEVSQRRALTNPNP